MKFLVVITLLFTGVCATPLSPIDFLTAFINGLLGVPPAQNSSTVYGVPIDSPVTTVSNNETQPQIKYATVWADDDGATHVGYCKIEGLQFNSYAPPAAPQWFGLSPDKIESISFAALPVGYVGDWHHSPGPQWVIVLSGRWSVETTDGSILEQGPGEFQFNADSTSRPRPDDDRVGHITRQVGNEPNLQLIVKLKANADISRTRGRCAY
ncbi:hypothetical protein HA402_006700 [Bradysia odoriphaga]|nr:hypothetical protein HA402_006700 [Bradysia odoriphaga]